MNNGVDQEVALRAKGVGSTLYCKEELKVIDFGTEYTHKNVPKTFFLENRGRKPMKIVWARQTKMDRNKPRKDTKDASGNDKKAATSSNIGGDNNKEEEEMKFVYTVVPDQINLNPKMGIMVEFRANSFHTGKISEQW